MSEITINGLRGLMFGLGLIALVGCSNNKTAVRRVLERDGYTDVEVFGWSLLGCGKDDAFVNGFRAKKGGQEVTGYVCGGFSKGLTVRVDE